MTLNVLGEDVFSSMMVLAMVLVNKNVGLRCANPTYNQLQPTVSCDRQCYFCTYNLQFNLPA